MQTITKTAEDTVRKIPELAQSATDNLGRAMQSFAENLGPIIDRLAGTQSTISLRFEDLTLDTGTAKAKISGSINLEATYTNEQKATSQSKAPMGGTSDKVDFGQVDRTVVNVE